MSPPRNGQLDQISEAIGELKGSVQAVERYVHDWRHSINNLTQKVDGVGTLVSREVAALEARIETHLSSMDQRIARLEAVQQQQAGAKNLATWFFQSPLIAWIAAAALFVAAYFTREGPP
jgi:uncharacterized protein YoxC